ncbi:MAG: prolyl oligopeptidase family serine peptidase [Streptosporangiaceae bacterium]
MICGLGDGPFASPGLLAHCTAVHLGNASYGGYMTSWTIGHTGRFRAACSERACNNLLTMEYTADIAGFLRSYVGPSHLDNPAAYTRASPRSATSRTCARRC